MNRTDFESNATLWSQKRTTVNQHLLEKKILWSYILLAFQMNVALARCNKIFES